MNRSSYVGLAAFLIALLPIVAYTGSVLAQGVAFNAGLIPLVGVYAIISAGITVPVSVILASLSIKRKEVTWVRILACVAFIVNVVPLLALVSLILFMLH